jgi:hypothetical protein
MTFAKRSAMALGLGMTLIGGAWAASSERLDGTWSVQMVTDSGICDRSYNYSIAIENGNVRYILAPGDSPTTVSGRVGPDGAVNLDIRRSIAKVDASGRLSDKSGSGTWKLGMLGCTGRWTAQKRSNTVQG